MSKARGYHFRLFVAGDEPNSRQARQLIERLCAGPLQGRATLEVIDVLKDFEAALEHHVLVAPTLIVTGPHAPVTLIGRLQDPDQVLRLVGVTPEEGRRA